MSNTSKILRAGKRGHSRANSGEINRYFIACLFLRKPSFSAKRFSSFEGQDLGCGHRAIRNPQTALDFLRIAAILNRTIFSSFCNPLGPGPGGH